jgi:hypothetical protein
MAVSETWVILSSLLRFCRPYCDFPLASQADNGIGRWLYFTQKMQAIHTLAPDFLRPTSASKRARPNSVVILFLAVWREV